MSISENKRIVGITALFALAFGGLMYYGFDVSGQADKAKAELARISDDFIGFEESDIQPTRDNVKAMQTLMSNMKLKRDALTKMMGDYKKACLGDGKAMSPSEYLVRIKNDRAAAKKDAEAAQCKLLSNAANFGKEDRDFETAPEAVRVAPLFFQHRVVSALVKSLIADGAATIDGIYCAPLPEDSYSDDDRWETVPMRFEVDFTVPRGVLHLVLNKIMSSTDFFLTITGMYVANEAVLAPMDAAPQPAEAIPAENAQNGENTVPAPPIAVLKAGSDAETIRVHLNLEVLYFNPKAQ